MSGSKGLKRYNGVEQDDEGAYVYYDDHLAALRRAKAEVVVDTVKAELTPIWLGGRQRMMLVDEIAKALTTTRQEALREAKFGERSTEDDVIPSHGCPQA